VPGHELLEALGVRSEALILTHPHRDHCRGFAELVGAHASGPVGCSPCWLELDTSLGDASDAEHVLARGGTEAALAAIQDRWERDPTTRWELEATSSQSVGDARVTVLYPDQSAVERFADGHGDANQLSSPLLIEWRSRRLLLGADLPRAQWMAVDRKGYGVDLERHDGLKLPHHGSKRSLHATFAESANRERVWVLAPWNREAGPPSLRDGGDLDALLEHVDEVHFTTILRRLQARLHAGDRVRLSELRSLITRIGFAGVPLEVVGVEPSERDAWVAIAFDDSGHQEIWHGDAALTVVR